MAKQSYAEDRYENDAYASDAYANEAYTEDAYTNEAYTEDAYANEAYTNEAYTEDVYEDDLPKPRTGFRVAAGVLDFFGVVGCTLLILVLMVVMSSLYTWLRGDLNTTFAGIGQNINEAVVIDVNNP